MTYFKSFSYLFENFFQFIKYVLTSGTPLERSVCFVASCYIKPDQTEQEIKRFDKIICLRKSEDSVERNSVGYVVE